MTQNLDTPDARRDRLAASFVPPSVRLRCDVDGEGDTPRVRSHWSHAALLWIDICGFTTLSKRLIKKGPRGAEILSQILRGHFDPLLRVICEQGGEPLFFAGDGLLAGWPCEEGGLKAAVSMALAAGEAAVACAPVKDELGGAVTSRYIVSCGGCHLGESGGVGGRWMVTAFGNAIDDLRAATHPWEPERLIVSPGVLKAAGEHFESTPLEHGCAQFIRQPAVPVAGTAPEPEQRSWDSLKGYVPEPVAVRLQSEHLEWLAELRRVTVVFVRLPAFARSHAAMLEQINEVVQTAQLATRRYDGILNQFWVDEKAANMLICFGPPPVAHVDSPARGVALALELHQTLAKAGHVSSIGVATGHAYCGILGNDLRRHYTVIGDAVNLAARLMALAEEGVRCEEATVRGARQEFTFTSAGEHKLKGVDDPVTVWTARSGGARGGLRARKPIVGRSKELALLTESMRRCAAPGVTQSLILEGESGLGKSRLVADFRARAAAMGSRVLAGQGSRVESAIPYHAWRGVFSSLLGMDGVQAGAAQQEAMLKALGEGFEARASLLNALLPVQLPDHESIASLSGKQRAEAIRELLLALLARAAAARPFAIVIDDAQWMDGESWDLAANVAAQVPQVFLICSMHPAEHEEMLAPLLAAGAQRIRLGALSDEDQDELVRATLGATTVPEPVAALIRRRAKGHPFLCIELAQSLLDEGLVQVEQGTCRIARDVNLDNVPLPDTVQGAVMRRIDRLEPGPELTLKVASVAGQRFSTEIVQSVYPLEQERANVQESLAMDERLGLVIADQVDGEPGYEFNHAITRDVAYGLMLFEQRRRLHGDIARWIESHRGGSLQLHYSELAGHWERAEEVLRAIDYLEKEAVQIFSNGFAKQSVEVGLRAAALLGLKLPSKMEEIRQDIGQQMGEVMRLLAGRAPADLMHLPHLDNPTAERLLWLLVRIAPFAFQSQQIDLYALIAVTCLRFTLEQGSGSPTPDVYAMYSVVHRGITGNRVEACGWGRLALDIDERRGGQMHGRVAFVHGWFHRHWVHPLRESLPLSLNAAEAGFASGDVLFACFNLSAHVVYQNALGRPLPEVMDTARIHLDRNANRVANAAFHLMHELQFAKAMAGLTRHPLMLTDDEYDEDKHIASICRTEFGNQIGYYLVSRVKLHAHFGDWWGALEWAERARPLRAAFDGQVAEIDLVQFLGIAAALAAVEAGEGPERSTALECAETMRQWAAMCPSNFTHKSALIEAVIAAIDGRGDDIATSFNAAAQMAADAGFLHDAVLAREHQGRWERRTGREVTALPHALELCKAWGAAGKAEYLAGELG